MWAQFAVVLCSLRAVQAVNVYLYPSQSFKSFLRPNLAPEDASAALSRHLGLELYDTLRDGSTLDYAEKPFVGQGPINALLLTLEEVDAKTVIPPSLPRSFRLPSSPITSLYSVITAYLRRARHSYTSIYASDPSSQVSKASYMDELTSIKSFFDNTDNGGFAAADLSGLASMRKTHGIDSEEYQTAVDSTRKLLSSAISNNIHIALLTFSSPPSSPAKAKRASAPQESQAPFPPAPPQSPIGSVSTCHTTLDACTNATSSCSGRGECVGATKSGRTCFVCSCGKKTTGEGNKVATETWVGESCERKDISAPFVLFAGTTIVLLLVVVGSIALLYSVGNIELPSVLLGGAVNGKKD